MIKEDMILATIESYWSWEYDTIIVKARLIMDTNNGNLKINFDKTNIKTGIGAGIQSTFIDSVNVGTFNKPLKRNINQLLSKHKLSDRPFKRNGWYIINSDKTITDGLKLSEVFNICKNIESISRSIKLNRIKKLIKGV